MKKNFIHDGKKRFFILLAIIILIGAFIQLSPLKRVKATGEELVIVNPESDAAKKGYIRLTFRNDKNLGVLKVGKNVYSEFFKYDILEGITWREAKNAGLIIPEIVPNEGYVVGKVQWFSNKFGEIPSDDEPMNKRLLYDSKYLPKIILVDNNSIENPDESRFVKITLNSGKYGNFSRSENKNREEKLLYAIKDGSVLSKNVFIKAGLDVNNNTGITISGDHKFDKWNPLVKYEVTEEMVYTVTYVGEDTTAPKISKIEDIVVSQGEEIKSFGIIVDDEEAIIEVQGLPEGIIYNEITKEISGVSKIFGEFVINVKATDTEGNFSTEEFKITIIEKKLEQSALPILNDIKVGDKEIAGIGTVGGQIKIILSDNREKIATVGDNGKWSVKLESPLVEGEKIIAIQTEEGKLESEIAERIVSKEDISEEAEIPQIPETPKEDIVEQEPDKEIIIPKPIEAIENQYLNHMDSVLFDWNPVKNEDTNKISSTAYIKGYSDGTFKPDENITRAEIATVFFRLYSEKTNIISNNKSNFNDVNNESWYFDAISFMNEKGIAKGYEDGSFKPEKPVTRAELTTMAVRFNSISIENNEINFIDLDENHWAYNAIKEASQNKWICGYLDGSFNPDKFITRAETVTIINKMLNRIPDKEYIKNNPIISNQFIDISDHWAFYDICEASK